MKKMRNAHILVRKLEWRRALTKSGVDGWTALKCILNRCGLHSSGSGQKTVAGSCENGNKPSGSIQGRGFLN